VIRPDFDDLVAVIRRVFDQDDLPIFVSTRSVDVPGWDSLSHVILILELQTVFNADIQPDETLDLPDVGALYDLLIAKIA
jgi:acyl carrier protein